MNSVVVLKIHLSFYLLCGIWSRVSRAVSRAGGGVAPSLYCQFYLGISGGVMNPLQVFG